MRQTTYGAIPNYLVPSMNINPSTIYIEPWAFEKRSIWAYCRSQAFVLWHSKITKQTYAKLELSGLFPPRNEFSQVCSILKARITQYLESSVSPSSVLLFVASEVQKRILQHVDCYTLHSRATACVYVVQCAIRGSDRLRPGVRTLQRCLLPCPSLGLRGLAACVVVFEAPRTRSFPAG